MDSETLHSRWTEQALVDIADLVSAVYSEWHTTQVLLCVVGKRPAVGLHERDGRDDVIEELLRRLPYPTFDPGVLSDVIICRRRQEVQAARRLVEEGPRMTGEEIHRVAGRAYGYPAHAVEFFVERFDVAYPTVADSRITANDLVREGVITPRAWEFARLIPYVYAGGRETVLREVERATTWAAALPEVVMEGL